MKPLALFLILISMNSNAQPLNDPSTWQGVTDQVMGGVSNLIIKHSEGIFYMTGNVSTDNNGGFVRLSNRVNISSNDFKGIKFKAKGNNETYEIHVTLKGLKIPPWSYFSQSFDVTDDWQEYQISFKDLKISETLPIIKNCNLYIGNDTGWLHISSALGVKCLALFMDSPVQAYGKYSKNIELILPEGETEETTTHDTLGAGKISFEKVFNKSIELLN